MIKKDVLLKELDKIVSIEEKIVPVLRDQLSAAFSFSGADGRQKEDFQQKLQQLADRGQKHIVFLKELIEDIGQKEDATF